MSLPVDFAKFVLRVARWLRWVVAGAAIGWLAILYLPIMPAQPICIHDGSGGPHRTLSGRLARDFHAEYVRLLADDIPFFTDGERVYVTLYHSWDFRLFNSASAGAMWTLIKRRNDIDPSEPVKLPGYPKWNRPSCAGIAAIAFKGGVWEFEGPDPVPLGVSAAEAAALEPPPAPIRPWTPPFLCFAAAFLVAAITALIVDQCRRFGWRRRGRVVEEAFVSAIQVFAATFAVASSAFLLLSQLWFLA